MISATEATFELFHNYTPNKFLNTTLQYFQCKSNKSNKLLKVTAF